MLEHPDELLHRPDLQPRPIPRAELEPDLEPVYGPAPRHPVATRGGRGGGWSRFLEGLADIQAPSSYGRPGDVFLASLLSGLMRGAGRRARSNRMQLEDDNASMASEYRSRQDRQLARSDAASRRATERLQHESDQARLDRRAALSRAPHAAPQPLAPWITEALGLPVGFPVDPASYAGYANAATSRGRYLRGDREGGGGDRFDPLLEEDRYSLGSADDAVREAEGDYTGAVREKADAMKLGAGWFPRPAPGQRTATPPGGVLPDTTSAGARGRMNMPAVRQAYGAADSKVAGAQERVDQAKTNRSATQASVLISAISRAKNLGQLARAFATIPKGSPLYADPSVREAYAQAKQRLAAAPARKARR